MATCELSFAMEQAGKGLIQVSGRTCAAGAGGWPNPPSLHLFWVKAKKQQPLCGKTTCSSRSAEEEEEGWWDHFSPGSGGRTGPVSVPCSKLLSSPGQGSASSRDFFDLLGDYCLLGSWW